MHYCPCDILLTGTHSLPRAHRGDLRLLRVDVADFREFLQQVSILKHAGDPRGRGKHRGDCVDHRREASNHGSSDSPNLGGDRESGNTAVGDGR